jgi:hypothetical protein
MAFFFNIVGAGGEKWVFVGQSTAPMRLFSPDVETRRVKLDKCWTAAENTRKRVRHFGELLREKLNNQTATVLRD